MSRIVITRDRGWSSRVYEAIKQAEGGDVIVVPHIDALDVGTNLAKIYFPEKELTFEIDDK